MTPHRHNTNHPIPTSIEIKSENNEPTQDEALNQGITKYSPVGYNELKEFKQSESMVEVYKSVNLRSGRNIASIANERYRNKYKPLAPGEQTRNEPRRLNNHRS